VDARAEASISVNKKANENMKKCPDIAVNADAWAIFIHMFDD
jgi:hypothetical protein